MPSVLYTGMSPQTFERPGGSVHLWPGHRIDIDADTLLAMEKAGVPLLVPPSDAVKAPAMAPKVVEPRFAPEPESTLDEAFRSRRRR